MTALRRPGPRRIAILGHVARPQVRRAVTRLRATLARQGREVRLDEMLAAEMDLPGYPLDELARWCQLLVTLGGDGTVLAGGRALAGRSGTLLSVNMGGLGFLAAAEAPELDRALRAACQGEWPVSRRRLVGAAVHRGGRRVRRGIALNDVVIKGAGGYAAIHLQLAALGQDLGHLVADGLIAASAAGSTAYSLSAGGPLLAPDLEALVVTPACPHSLGSRSLVLAADAEISVRLIGSFDRTLLLLDGQDSSVLEPGDEVRIRLDRTAVRMFQNPRRAFVRALRVKLGWQGSRKRSL
jgi:NAD+ kinase